MTFDSITSGRRHNIRFFLTVDGLPYVFCEQAGKILLDIYIKGDLNLASEYMTAHVGGVQIGGNLSSGIQDDTYRQVITDHDVTSLVQDSVPVSIQGTGSAAVTASGSWTNAMKFVFKTEDDSGGDGEVYELYDVQAGVAVTGDAHPRTYLQCVLSNGFNFGASRLDLERRKQIGGSVSVDLRDTDTRQLRALFAPRTPAKAYLESTLPAATTNSVDISTAAGLSNNTLVYLASETIFSEAFVAGTPSTMTKMARGRFDSEAKTHLGSSSETPKGVDVFTSPPGFTGRRAKVRAGYLKDDGTFDSFDIVGVYRLDQAPSYIGADTWQFNFVDLSGFFENRKAYVGYEEMKVHSESFFPEVQLSADTISVFSTTGSETTYAFISGEWSEDSGNDGNVFGLVEYTSSATAISGVFGSDLISPTLTGIVANPLLTRSIKINAAQHVFFLSGDPVAIFLKIALSKTGDGSNSATYDVLPGADRTSYGGYEFSMGARIDASDIDISSFEELSGTGLPITVVLKEQMSIGELLEALCLSTRSFWYVTSLGKLSIRRLRQKVSALAAAGLTSITDANTLVDTSGAISLDQNILSSIVSVKANYSIIDGEYNFTETVFDAELFSSFPDQDGVHEIESRFLHINGGITPRGFRLNSAMSVDWNMVGVALRRIQKSFARGLLLHKIRADWSVLGINAGDIVTVTNSTTPDYEGSTLSAKNFLVSERKINTITGEISLVGNVQEKGFLIAPSGAISSYNSGTTTITFNASDSSWGGNDPTDHFYANQDIYIYDVTGAVKEAATVGSITNATVMILSMAPSFTPAAGDICFPAGYGGTPSANELGFTVDDDCIFQVVRGSIGVSTRGTRWN